jgi:hypothetical protein
VPQAAVAKLVTDLRAYLGDTEPIAALPSLPTLEDHAFRCDGDFLDELCFRQFKSSL